MEDLNEFFEYGTKKHVNFRNFKEEQNLIRLEKVLVQDFGMNYTLRECFIEPLDLTDSKKYMIKNERLYFDARLLRRADWSAIEKET